ncbi:hypothetical protein ACP70R_046059 [Stipagrostis hirtigluma subsp. patula]
MEAETPTPLEVEAGQTVCSKDEAKLMKNAICDIFEIPKFSAVTYIRAVADVDNIREYDWSKFIVEDLIKSSDNSMFTSFPKASEASITGCIIFLQVLYLSNLDVGAEYVTSSASPHIATFEDEQLKDAPIFASPSSCYQSSVEQQKEKAGSLCMDCISKYIQRRFKSKMVSAVMGVEAQSKIIDMVEDAHSECCIILDDFSDFVINNDDPSAIKASQKFRSLLEQTFFSDTKEAVVSTLRNVLGSSREDSNAPDGPLSDGKHICNKGYGVTEQTNKPGIPRPHSNGHNSIGSSQSIDPPSFDLGITEEFSTPKNSYALQDDSSKKRSSTVSPTSKTRMTQQTAEDGDDHRKRRKYTIENPPSHLLRQKTKRNICPSKKLLSPFISRNCILERLDERVATELYSCIMSNSDKPLLQLGGQMDSDCLNLGIRKLYNTEVGLFKNTSYLGWRHFINLDFGMFAVAGEEFWDPEHQLAHFVGPEIEYDVSECHMFTHYVVYAFDMENQKIAILDSVLRDGPLGENRLTRRMTVDSLHSITCGTGMAKRLINQISEDSATLQKQFLLQLLTFEGNKASLPELVKQQLHRIRN